MSPQPGDRITDRHGETWTFMSTTPEGRWFCHQGQTAIELRPERFLTP